METYPQELNARSTKAHNYLHQYIKDSIEKALPIIDLYIINQFTKIINCLTTVNSARGNEFRIASECNSELQAIFSKTAFEDLMTDLKDIFDSTSLHTNFKAYVYDIINAVREALEEKFQATLSKANIPVTKKNIFTSIILTQKLRTLVSQHNTKQYKDAAESFKMLLLNLVKERMKHDFIIINHDIIKRDKMSFVNTLRCWAASHFGNPSLLIEDIISLHASVDYGHPQGDETARDTIAEALSPWYNLKITRDNILFVASSAEQMINNSVAILSLS